MQKATEDNSLHSQYPELAKEWNYEKNGDLMPSGVAPFSNKKVWWLCDNGHEWQAAISNRSNGTGCPYCRGRLPIPGMTDLANVNPLLAKEWHPTKNGKLKPSDVTASSGKKVWWLCAKGHEWQATILKPSDVTISSSKKVWWKCEKGHEWQTSINHRNKGTGCPYCAGKLPIPGMTDLATINPKLANEWHPTKNRKFKPSDVTVFSGKKVWWTCEKGHEWQATIINRSKGKGCPYCSGRLPINGLTDLASVNPPLAKWWNYQKNGGLKPSDVAAFSNKMVWWRCDKNHEWRSTILNRSNGNGCPYCAGKVSIPGITDLATVNPKLAKEWHPIKNGNLKPIDVTTSSGKKVWWLCDKGHEWQVRIADRHYGTGCPYCAGQLPIPGLTDLAAVNPQLVKEWHPTKNGILRPSDMAAFSDKKVWWFCEKGHEWQASISSRSNGKNCPICNNKNLYKNINI